MTFNWNLSCLFPLLHDCHLPRDWKIKRKIRDFQNGELNFGRICMAAPNEGLDWIGFFFVDMFKIKCPSDSVQRAWPLFSKIFVIRNEGYK